MPVNERIVMDSWELLYRKTHAWAGIYGAGSVPLFEQQLVYSEMEAVRFANEYSFYVTGEWRTVNGGFRAVEIKER